MSGAQEQRKRRPPRIFLVVSDLKFQDHLDGTIRLQRGNICQEQDAGRSRGEHIWVKVLDYGCVVKVDKQYLTEVPSELSGFLEPVSEPESRLKLLANPRQLQRLANLPMGTPLCVHLSQSGEPVEAELRFRGPVARGSSAVLFGVQLKGAAVGRGVSNGSYKGHQLFICPEASALFLPANQISLPRSSRGNSSEQHDNGHHDNHQRQPSVRSHPSHPFTPAGVSVLPRTAESAPLQPPVPNASRGPASPPPLQVGQRVCFPHEDTVHGGEVRYCGPLPGRASSGTYVGILLDLPVGNWDGSHRGERLCHIPSPLYGHLLPLSKVSAEPKSRRQALSYTAPAPALAPAPAPNSRLVLKLTQSTPGPTAPPAAPKPPPSALLTSAPKPSPSAPLTSAPKPSPSAPLTSAPKPSPSAPLTSAPKPSPSAPLTSAPKPSPSAPLTSAPKIALMPPQLRSAKLALKPPSPPNKPANKPLPLPPIKAQDPPSPTVTDQPQPSNGAPPNALWSPGYGGVAEENEDTGLEVELEVGSMVEVNDPPLFGVIRWIGQISGVSEPVAGIELDQELTAGTDGSYLGERHFRCPANKGLFVKLRNCRRDSRFPAPETPVNQVERCNSIAFAEWGSERVEDLTPPEEGEEAKQRYQGWKRGIQGHLNSCYLDASLFSLFSCCSSADWVLLWPSDSEVGSNSSLAQDLLRCEIVNPLRRFGYVCASKTMALRRLLEAENSDTGFTNQEKDPEEFLNKLFQILRVEALLKIRSMTQQPQECHLYQLFPPSAPLTPASPVPLSPLPLSSPPASLMRVASVQILLERSFLHTGLKFTEAPSCLPLLMPRFGKDFKMFDAILPSLSIDITDLLDDTLRQCSICQAVAQWECMQCFDDPDITPGKLKQYCHTCNTQVHSHRKRASHCPGQVTVPGGPWTGPLHAARQKMSLFAVTCIETSHYVSFVKHGPQPSDWLFFDSMADREGGENGFNIPQVRACPEVGRYLSLSEEELSRIDPASLRESVRRLLCDSYMCLYHSPELSLYK